VAELTIARADIETIIQLDTDRDGAVSLSECSSASSRLEKLAREAWSICVGEKSTAAELPGFSIDKSNNVHLTVAFPMQIGGALKAHCLLLDRLPRGHRQFVTLVNATNGVLAQALLSADQDVITGDLSRLSSWPPVTPTSYTFREFVKMGVQHIVTGYDHLLFLFGLLIVVPSLRAAGVIITCFTLAHSITLGLATLEVAQIPSKLVEPLIAATIVYVGVENLFARNGPHWRWVLTLVFGLVHGLDSPGAARNGSWLLAERCSYVFVSFNLGVELGQIAIAAIVLPALLWLRRHPVFTQRCVPALSVIISVLGAWWLLERTLMN
jgi:hydrogenase/urease accessory protein HupE